LGLERIKGRKSRLPSKEGHQEKIWKLGEGVVLKKHNNSCSSIIDGF
jgi:hypothetical protein